MENVEQWRLVDGYDNYSVSNCGRVRNDRTARILRQYLMFGTGYKIVMLSKNSKSHTYTVHRLVCFAFVDNIDNRQHVDHIDRNRHNNSADNLRWVTHSQNMRNSTKPKNNTSGKQGVFKMISGIHEGWASFIIDNDSKRRQRFFSITKLGNDEAFRRAVEQRKAWEQLFGYLGD